MSDHTVSDELAHLDDIPEDPTLNNEDLKPATADERTWSRWSLAALWVAMSISIPTYLLAGQLVSEMGMLWWQVMLAALVGNALVLIPMILNGHAGTKYGIPFPVFGRASFGVYGTHIPSIARALVACGWFGIQTFVGGQAISVMIGMIWDGWGQLAGGAEFVGMSLELWISFLIFWAINIGIVVIGTEAIRWLENLAAPFLIAIGFALLWWAISETEGLAYLLEQSTVLIEEGNGGEEQPTGFAWLIAVFLPAVTAMVGFWATLSLNIPDFTRYVEEQKEQVVGQILGLPTTMLFFTFIAVTVTSATVLVFDEEQLADVDEWNPVELVGLIVGEDSLLLVLVAMVALAVATLSTNIAANVVAPANSFANAFPKWISFRTGGIITGIIGIVICPWLLIGHLPGFLVAYSGLLGPVGGILIADYWLVRRTRLDIQALYDSDGKYRYTRGFNLRGITALVLGIAVVLLGLAHPSLRFLFDGAWFTGFGVSLVVYVILMRGEIDGADEPKGPTGEV